MLVTIVVFILILSILVLIHEAGHFLVAKLLDIKVEEFGIGLPPRAFGIKRGETIYSVNWLPIGGFVKLYGEDDAGAGRIKSTTKKEAKGDVKRAFFARPVWQRGLVVVAGVVMNFLLASVLLAFLAGTQGVVQEGKQVTVNTVVPDSPAAQAGLAKGDKILTINGKEVQGVSDLIITTRTHLGEKLMLHIRSGQAPNKERDIVVTPRKNYPKNQGPMGVAIGSDQHVIKYAWYQTPAVGLREAAKLVGLIFSGFGLILGQLFSHGSVPDGTFAGPVGMAQATGQFVQNGIYAVLAWMALLSVNLAVLNILPFPALDGGRFFFIVLEGITRRKINPRFEEKAHVIGMAILIGLILLITLHDILRIASGQPVLPQ